MYIVFRVCLRISEGINFAVEEAGWSNTVTEISDAIGFELAPDDFEPSFIEM